MGDSLGFHIIFVMFGLTLPVLVSWFEWVGIRKKDQRYLKTARLWSKIMTVLVITGVLSGTIIALQMSLVWPGILQFGGQVIGLPFMFETYAFLIEAIFLALYMATWQSKRVAPLLHWSFSLFIILGSALSAFAITSVNAFMNLPTGFMFVQGKLENIDVFRAMFSETSLIEFAHSMPGYYLAASLAIAGIYGIKIARDRYSNRLKQSHSFDWTIMQRLVLFAAACLVAVIITADLTGKYLAKHEPAKLATIEIVDHTTANAPFIFGGVEGTDGKVAGPYIKIPDALSILAGGSPSYKVTGLNEIPEKYRPPEYIRAIFNLKLTLIMLLTAALAAYLALRAWRPVWLARASILVPISLIFFSGIVIVEFGWIITEVGRQPWAVRGYVTTAQALTKTHDITSFGYFFPLSYVALFAVTILALRRIVDSKQRGDS